MLDGGHPADHGPGYVSWRSPIADTRLWREEWDGKLAATVTVLTPVHIGYRWHTWERVGPFEGDRLEEPRGWPRATGQVELSDLLDLPEALRRPERPADVALVSEAKPVISAVVNALHRRFAEALDELTASTPTAR